MREPGDLIDPKARKVRVLADSCDTCVFRSGNLMRLRKGRLEQLVNENRQKGALLTCHQTFPYGDFPDFGPAACFGFFEAFWRETSAGRLAVLVIGIIRIPPPKLRAEEEPGDDQGL